MRQRYADVLNFGAGSKSEWSDAAKAYSEIRVPRYREWGYDIYRDLTESPRTKVRPLTAVSKIGAAKEILDRTFGRLRTGND